MENKPTDSDPQPTSPGPQNKIDALIANERHAAMQFNPYAVRPGLYPTRGAALMAFFQNFRRQWYFLPVIAVVSLLFITSVSLAIISNRNKEDIIALETAEDGSIVASNGSNIHVDDSTGGTGTDEGTDSPASTDSGDDTITDSGSGTDDTSLDEEVVYDEDIAADDTNVDSDPGVDEPDPDTDTNVDSDPGTDEPDPDVDTSPIITPPPASIPSTTPTLAAASKLLVFVEENHSYAQAKSGMPYAWSLAQQYGYATNSKGTTHPSLPNYISIAAGHLSGVNDNGSPSSNKVTGTSVFGQAISKGKTAMVFADGMQSNCATSNGGTKYAVKHNPWPYFINERADCNKFNVSMSRFDGVVSSGTLPTAGMVSPNLCNDAHDCSLKTADNWFKTQMAKIFAGPDWKAGRLAVVFTFDEDNKKSGNQILTVIIHPTIKNKVVSTPITHYSLTRLYAEFSHATPLRNGASANSISSAFGLRIQ